MNTHKLLFTPRIKKMVAMLLTASALLTVTACSGDVVPSVSDTTSETGTKKPTVPTIKPNDPNWDDDDSKEPIMPPSSNFKTISNEQFNQIWSIENEDSSHWKLVQDKGLVITSQKSELFQSDNDCKNIFVQESSGNYIVETKITFDQSLTDNFQQAGLMIYTDNDNYVKAMYAYNGSETSMQFAREESGNMNWSVSSPTSTNQVWIRIKKDGNTYTAYYTVEGPYSGFQELGSCTAMLNCPKIAIAAFNGMTGAPEVEFVYEYVNVLDVNTPDIIEWKYEMSMNESELRLNPGQTAQLSATAVGVSAAEKVTYKSSDEAIVKVDANGLITAVGEGFAAVTATAEAGKPAVCVICVVPEELYVYESIGNPYLPNWEHIPDGEPYVFEDPDNPGKYRVYVYGSHDTKLVHYCGYEAVVWSAPIDDLTKWTYHGEIFKSTVQGTKDTIYAPDVVEVIAADGTKTYYFYPNNQTGGRRNMVTKSSRPDGPFTVCNWATGSITKTEGPLGFDVAVLRDDDGRVYGYWGFENNEDCCWAELNPDDMATLKEGTQIHRLLPTRTEIDSPNYTPALYNIVQDENVNKWGFFEAPSIRKVGNKYVLIFSRRGLRSEPTGQNTFQLAYGYSDSPAGPWKWGGIIVDAGGETIPGVNGYYTRTFPSDNTHGSICEINGQWYIFYHRSHNAYSRQSMADAITVEWDEKAVTAGGAVRISMAEVTSKGFHLDGLEPYAKYPASIICYMVGAKIPAVYEKNQPYDPVVITQSQSIVGVKYLNLSQNAPVGKSTKLAATFLPMGKNVTVDVYLRPTTAVNTPAVWQNGQSVSVGEGSIKVGSFVLSADMARSEVTMQIPADQVDRLDGQWGLFFAFTSEAAGDLCELISFELFTDEPTVEHPEEGEKDTVYDFTAMTKSQLAEQWEIVREDADHWSLEAGKGLVLNNQQSGLYGNGGACSNLFLTDVEGDYTVTAKVSLSQPLTANWQQFVLLIYQDDDNYIKMNYGMNGGTGCQLLFEKNGTEAKSFGAGLETQSIWLRIQKTGNTYIGYYSVDGYSFTPISEGYEFKLTNAKIGLAAYNDGGEAPQIDFTVSYVEVKHS